MVSHDSEDGFGKADRDDANDKALFQTVKTSI